MILCKYKLNILNLDSVHCLTNHWEAQKITAYFNKKDGMQTTAMTTQIYKGGKREKNVIRKTNEINENKVFL